MGINKKRLWWKFFQILFAKIPVVLSVGITVILFLAGWAINFRGALLNAFIWIMSLITLGTIGHLFILSGDQMARQAMQDLKKEADDSRQERLDDLYDRLAKDRDPRTHRALKELRELAAAVKDSATEESTLDARSKFEMDYKVEQLFQKCVNRLEKSLKLLKNAQAISNQDVKEKLLSLRENLLEEVQKTIRYLGEILTRIQVLHQKETSDDSDMKNIMSDLEEGLAVAERVDLKMKELEQNKDVLE